MFFLELITADVAVFGAVGWVCETQPPVSDATLRLLPVLARRIAMETSLAFWCYGHAAEFPSFDLPRGVSSARSAVCRCSICRLMYAMPGPSASPNSSSCICMTFALPLWIHHLQAYLSCENAEETSCRGVILPMDHVRFPLYTVWNVNVSEEGPAEGCRHTKHWYLGRFFPDQQLC